MSSSDGLFDTNLDALADAFDDGTEEDLGASNVSNSEEDIRFDEIVTVLESVILDPEFQAQVESFCNTHCDMFDVQGTELKLEYTPLFEAYTELTEGKISQALESHGITEEEVAMIMTTKADQLAGDVFDALLAMGDFEEFVSLMQSYKEQKVYNNNSSSSSSSSISSSNHAAADGSGGNSVHLDGDGNGSNATVGAGSGESASSTTTSTSTSSSFQLPSYVGLAPTIISLSPVKKGKPVKEEEEDK